MSMEADAVVRQRLSSQLLREPGAPSPEAALRNLLAVQAQEFPYARWSLAQRVSRSVDPPVTAADIESAVADGRILRTHILRPTWHFVHRDDLRWLSALSAPRLHQANAPTYRLTGIDAATAARAGEVLAGAVAGGNHLNREQLAAKLQAAGIGASGLRLAYIIMHAEVSGVLVSGTPVRSRGGALKQTYTLFDERVPAGRQPAPGREEALAELTLRYFSSRGPATAKDCAGWSGLTVTDVRKGLQVAREARPNALAATVIDGVEHYFAADRPDPGTQTGRTMVQGPRVDVVQCYDEYIMGYSATRHYMGGGAPAFPFEGQPMHVVLLDGRMAGSWRHTLLPGRCELDIRLTSSDDRPGTPLAAAVQEAVDRYGAFTGLPAVRVHHGAKLEGHTHERHGTVSNLFFWIIILSFLIPMAMRMYRKSVARRNHEQSFSGRYPEQFPGGGQFPGSAGPQSKQPRDGYTQQDYLSGGFRDLDRPQPLPPVQPVPPMDQQFPPMDQQFPPYGQPQPEQPRQGQPQAPQQPAAPATPPPPSAPQGYRARKLAELDEKYSNGELSVEEYMTRRGEIMNG